MRLTGTDPRPVLELEYVDCPECLGAGEVHWNTHPRNDPQYEQSARCPTCHGQGVVAEGTLIATDPSQEP